jgi:spermidine synthase
MANPKPVPPARRSPQLAFVVLLLCTSGACALVYQVAWLRMLRLVFGTSTAASAAVLAIFMGGLGFGGVVLGPRSDRHRRPLQLYARLEAGVAAAAAVSPLLVAIVQAAYVGVGGSDTLGLLGGTVVRLLLAAVVLGVPTFLMGGTLPAAARAVEDAADTSRRRMGLLYGANTFGAVLGTLWATFVSLETLGTNLTVWSASLVNAVVALLAFGLARRAGSAPAPITPAPAAGRGKQPVVDDSAAPLPVILAAAGVVGFAFLLMELVWYRMLSPLLGGSTYTFGLILSVALAGIAAGGLLYAAGRQSVRPTLMSFAATCALEALLIAVPYAAGDQVALFALGLRSLRPAGLGALVVGWTLVTTIVVLPAALVAGYQFPLLVGLLGAAERRVGRDVGAVYAANTVGSIIGSLAGGFGVLPWLSAPGTWRATVALLSGLAGVAAVYATRGRPPWWRGLLPAGVAALSVTLCWGTAGPTAVWRHTGIGAGRLELSTEGGNDLRAFMREKRRVITWESEGRESAVALHDDDGYGFLVNGKSDGNAIGDAPMQVMGGLLGAALHPELKRVLVIGLGTGSTAGWLGQIPSVERVDVVELEPAVLHIAELCRAVNQNVLANPKVHVRIGDGREFLLTTGETYDLIFSEPSNPYRAGVASLFSRDFYRAVAARLRPDGVFVQWLQSYDARPQALRVVYATLASVFPSVETWEATLGFDLVLTARRTPPRHDLARLRSRMETEPYRSALALVWGVTGAEGLYSGYFANDALPAQLGAAFTGGLNTDDRTVLEFEFARTVGAGKLFDLNDLRLLLSEHSLHRPASVDGTVDWAQVEELRSARAVSESVTTAVFAADDPALKHRLHARDAYIKDDLAGARASWLAQSEEPKGPMDLAMVGEVLADAGDPRARQYIDQLRPLQPAEADALLARLAERSGDPQRASEHLIAAFRSCRQHPWTHRKLFNRAIDLAVEVTAERPELVPGVFEALGEPFAAHALQSARLRARAVIGLRPGQEQFCVAALAPLEPNVPWQRDLLERRAACYARAGHPLAAQARADLNAFTRTAPTLEQVLLPAASSPPRN